MQITTKTFNEEVIDWKKFQIIPITDEMKSKYPTLKKYKELIISGEEMNWNDAIDYAKKNRAVLPDREEGQDIAELIIDSRYKDYYWMFWIRKEASVNEAYCVESNCQVGIRYKRSNIHCFCLR